MTELTLYRAHKPQWSFAPKSGEGAKKHGGRWNLPGTPALYLSFNPMPAIAETMKGHDFRPVTLVQYLVSGGKIADFRDADFRKQERLRDDLAKTPWLGKAFKGISAPSQNAAVTLIEAGWHGMIYPAAESEGLNLVLWRWDDGEGPDVEVLDTDGDLPKNQNSWR